MIVLAVDPGNEESAYVHYDTATGALLTFGKVSNADMRTIVQRREADHFAVEMIASYGMPVGREVFETCVWIGRLVQTWEQAKGRGSWSLPGWWSLVYRRDVKLHLCASARAKDGNVRQALLDRYGGKDRAIGKKASPGPLYGVSADVWSALAIAVTWADADASNLAKESA